MRKIGLKEASEKTARIDDRIFTHVNIIYNPSSGVVSSKLRAYGFTDSDKEGCLNLTLWAEMTSREIGKLIDEELKK